MASAFRKYKVLIDLDRLRDLNNGLGQVALNFGNALLKTEVADMDFTFLVPEKFVGYFGDKVNYVTTSVFRRYFPAFLEKFDLWYTIHQDCSFLPGHSSTPFVMTINDLNFLGEKSSAKAERRLRLVQKSVNRAMYLTTISEYSASMIRKNLQLGPVPLEVIYDGVEVFEFPDAIKPAYVPEGKILFSVGVIREKKNLLVLIPFLEKLPKEYILIMAGNKNSTYALDIERQAKELGLGQRVVLPGQISDADKYWLFSNCEAVLFPSKFEGMGFPPIEAMRMGKPVFASTFSSIPEVCGSMAFYWNDFDPLKMAELFTDKIKEFHSNRQMSEMLKQHSLKYTWENSVLLYLELFRKLLAGSKI